MLPPVTHPSAIIKYEKGGQDGVPTIPYFTKYIKLQLLFLIEVMVKYEGRARRCPQYSLLSLSASRCSTLTPSSLYFTNIMVIILNISNSKIGRERVRRPSLPHLIVIIFNVSNGKAGPPPFFPHRSIKYASYYF